MGRGMNARGRLAGFFIQFSGAWGHGVFPFTVAAPIGLSVISRALRRKQIALYGVPPHPRDHQFALLAVRVALEARASRRPSSLPR